jgi:TonB family protein
MYRLPFVLVAILASVTVSEAQEQPCAKPGKSLVPIFSTHIEPAYPTASQRRGETGAVVMAVSVGVDGAPADVLITRSSGVERLDELSVRQVKSRWRWEPPTEDCKPVTAQMAVTFVWYLGAPPKSDWGLIMPANLFPAIAVDQGNFGDTYLELFLDDLGAVQDGRIVYSSGFAELDEKALSIAKTTPGLLAGKLSGTKTVLFRWKAPAGRTNLETLLIRAQKLF